MNVVLSPQLLLESAAARRGFRRRLLAWFRKHQRELPWRNTSDPYLVWVSEIMLQQTQVTTVVPYFQRFVAVFPTVDHLAGAAEENVLRLWEGLGYYRRARQMHQAAQVIQRRHGGVFPEQFDEVLALPGVGRYTAGAILSIARDQRRPILEANTIRLFARLLAYGGDVGSAAAQKSFWQLAEALLPRRGAGELNQALMELGSEICRPRDPACSTCPAAMVCPTFAAGKTNQIPAPKARPKFEEVTETAVIIRRGEKTLLMQRGGQERWAGLWDYPRAAVDGSLPQNDEAIIEQIRERTKLVVRPGELLTTIKHGVTRYRITLHCRQADYVSGPSKSNDTLRWYSKKELKSLPLSSPGRKISRLELKP